ncbi:O-6-methylguanine DNA methyltransferase [Sutterella wadsworthensis]|jgi:O-6-methylguanine DNA methyltransferase|uniref:methylated-DNA--[protein]-cysteine S-methyltransferase n=1 Tax=Sutterella wadsworthensis HGA0223 TaxID=1203554 RepID=S3CHD3_9BURK|nr:methylated-DNA-[protein]-cysteine S-methyltransferase [Sutterella wadsworthensis HGA0223]QQS88744.1 MGMT family protein [Sutterella wadsworthensis]RBP56480.1 O-6-methylguanine DNA methyltransferase [Sutterella wadsworthensis]CCZ16780.1 methylated-DNA-protein-cysteine methyltransferase [Sutterella wadsworthensis CAG:135]
MIGSEFQARVWHALTKIPYGKTISYGEIAREVNSPKAVRAVGGAVGANLFSIIIPCHRVVGANGSPSRAMAADMPPSVIFLRWNLGSRLTSSRSAAA